MEKGSFPNSSIYIHLLNYFQRKDKEVSRIIIKKFSNLKPLEMLKTKKNSFHLYRGEYLFHEGIIQSIPMKNSLANIKENYSKYLLAFIK